MSNLNNYYRAFKNYRKETVDNNVCERDRLAIASSNIESDVLEATKYLCHIDEEWIKTIEEGLEFVEKAVAEERQFIRTQGEVIEIEKVRKISKDSVEHLARHSEMITHVPEDEDADLIPDKLYMVEKLSDYAVYENRFLYMMLCYLRDFINYRLERIEKLRSTYVADLSINKEITSKKRTLILETKIHEERLDNPFPIPDEESAALIQRIKNCNQIVLALLNTDLMVQVAKAPMIKPPITKTNVLKMNNNFKRSLALYDYVASYRSEGYTYEEVKTNLAPYSEKMADELAEAFNLPVFLSYKYGNDIEEYLENEYQIEERKRKELEAQKLVEQIQRLKKRALESNKTMEEYMLLLEKRNKMLERDSEELTLAKHEIEKLNAVIEQLNAEKEELNRRIEELEAVIEEKIREINYLNQKYIEDMARVKKEHELEIIALKEAHQNEIDEINQNHENEINELNQAHQDEIDELINKHNDEIDALNLKHNEEIMDLKEQHALDRQKLIDDYETRLDDITTKLNESKVKYDEMKEDYDNQVLVLNEKIKDLTSTQRKLVKDYEDKLTTLKQDYSSQLENQEVLSSKAIQELTTQKMLVVSELDAIRAQQGKLTPSLDYTSRERFSEMEEEFEAFKKFFKEQWKLTKKQIRKEVLWAKQEAKKTNKEEVKEEKTIENNQLEEVVETTSVVEQEKLNEENDVALKSQENEATNNTKESETQE